MLKNKNTLVIATLNIELKKGGFRLIFSACSVQIAKTCSQWKTPTAPDRDNCRKSKGSSVKQQPNCEAGGRPLAFLQQARPLRRKLEAATSRLQTHHQTHAQT